METFAPVLNSLEDKEVPNGNNLFYQTQKNNLIALSTANKCNSQSSFLCDTVRSQRTGYNSSKNIDQYLNSSLSFQLSSTNLSKLSIVLFTYSRDSNSTLSISSTLIIVFSSLTSEFEILIDFWISTAVEQVKYFSIRSWLIASQSKL